MEVWHHHSPCSFMKSCSEILQTTKIYKLCKAKYPVFLNYLLKLKIIVSIYLWMLVASGGYF